MNTYPPHGETFCISTDADNGVLIKAVRETIYRMPPEIMQARSVDFLGVMFETVFPYDKK